MEKVSGIGGFFFRAQDPAALGAWYRDHLGVGEVPSSDGDLPWRQEAGPTAFSPFPKTTDYFGDSGKVWMINFRVDDLTEFVAALRARGVEVQDPAECAPVGWFARLNDPEGNPIELWEVAADRAASP